MHSMNHEMHTTFILSTHDPRVLPYIDRRVYLEDGLITRIERERGAPMKNPLVLASLIAATLFSGLTAQESEAADFSLMVCSQGAG
jgi:energy-coupling factor transporter ATP-binding protein EcfA2